MYTESKNKQQKKFNMLIVNLTKHGNIEKGLKELKSKVITTQQTKKLNEKKTYTKKSVQRRRIVLNAIYKTKKYKKD